MEITDQSSKPALMSLSLFNLKDRNLSNIVLEISKITYIRESLLWVGEVKFITVHFPSEIKAFLNLQIHQWGSCDLSDWDANQISIHRNGDKAITASMIQSDKFLTFKRKWNAKTSE